MLDSKFAILLFGYHVAQLARYQLHFLLRLIWFIIEYLSNEDIDMTSRLLFSYNVYSTNNS